MNLGNKFFLNVNKQLELFLSIIKVIMDYALGYILINLYIYYFVLIVRTKCSILPSILEPGYKINLLRGMKISLFQLWYLGTIAHLGDTITSHALVFFSCCHLAKTFDRKLLGALELIKTILTFI